MTYSLLYPICISLVIIISSFLLNEEINIGLVLHYSIGTYLQIYALGSISLLCVSIFLDSNKSMMAAGVIAVLMYLLEGLGGVLPFLGSFQNFSIFHYFKIDSILSVGNLPLIDIFIVAGIGCIALIGSLIIFDKREFVI